MFVLFRCLSVQQGTTVTLSWLQGVIRPSQTASAARLLTGLILCSRFLCQNKKIVVNMTAPIHVKARKSPYPNSDTARLPVDDAKVPWSVLWPDYKPTDFTAPKVLAGPVWADPDIKTYHDAKKMKFNKLDGKTNRKTHCKDQYEIEDDGRPRNPCGRTGLRGRGELGKWGPNHAADPIVTRWKRDASGAIQKGNAGKSILQFISIRRKDNGDWAIPGGMVDPGEKVSVTLKREFGEEALNSLATSDKEKAKLKKEVDKLFKHGQEVYRGYVDDPRNTDNSWMETIAVNFHDDHGSSVGKFTLHAGDDAAAVHWMDISAEKELYASHQKFISEVTKLHDAHW